MIIDVNCYLSLTIKSSVYVCNGATFDLGNGSVSQDVCVDHDCPTNIYGKVAGDIIALPGSFVDIHGTVNGTVYNQGGRVRIYGVVGRVVKHSGETHIDAAATVQNC